MALLHLKIVPDVRPNAYGDWIVKDVPVHLNPFDFVPLEGYHVVKYKPYLGYLGPERIAR